MFKSQFLIIFLVCLCGLGVAYFLMSASDAPSKEIRASSSAETNVELDPNINARLEKADRVLQAAQSLTNEATKPEASSVKRSASGWALAEPSLPQPSIKLSEQISIFQAIEISRPEETPRVGDQISFPMFHGESVLVDVQSVKNHSDGSYSWSGHLVGHGDDYPVVVTYGEHSAFATITTPEGSYTMESVDGLGWLYKNPSEFELSKPGSTDVLEIPEAHQP